MTRHTAATGAAVAATVAAAAEEAAAELNAELGISAPDPEPVETPAPQPAAGLTPEQLAAAMGMPQLDPGPALAAIAAAHATCEREMGRPLPQTLPHNLAQARWLIAAALLLTGTVEMESASIPARARYFLLLAQGRRR